VVPLLGVLFCGARLEVDVADCAAGAGAAAETPGERGRSMHKAGRGRGASKDRVIIMQKAVRIAVRCFCFLHDCLWRRVTACWCNATQSKAGKSESPVRGEVGARDGAGRSVSVMPAKEIENRGGGKGIVIRASSKEPAGGRGEPESKESARSRSRSPRFDVMGAIRESMMPVRPADVGDVTHVQSPNTKRRTRK
jgi:hypothetical protein